jgi:hypothetical protein
MRANGTNSVDDVWLGGPIGVGITNVGSTESLIAVNHQRFQGCLRSEAYVNGDC